MERSGYVRGVAALLAGDVVAATTLLRGAVHDEPESKRAQAALAVALWRGGSPRAEAAARQACATVAAHHLSRRDRQHAAVLSLAVLGQVARASALALEHLLEFPDDALVAHVLGVLR